MRRAIQIIPGLLSLLLFSACAPARVTVPLSTDSSLFVVNLQRSMLMEFSSDQQFQRDLPIQLPCPLSAVHPSPNQARIALELECANGPLVQIVDASMGSFTTPFTEADSHFLAWDHAGNIYLRVDALGSPRLMRAAADGATGELNLPVQTYDMDFSPDGSSLVYSISRGLGLGSETWVADPDGRHKRQLLADEDSIITFARWSPDGKRIAYIKMPDSQTPFPMGELWVMEADGGSPRRLAPADAGHGYAAAWSPDSTRIAFVGRENPDEAAADQSAGALISNIYLVNSATGEIDQVTHFNERLIESPQWAADGHFLAFSVVTLNDTIAVWTANLVSSEVIPLDSPEATCCPVWIRK